MGGDPSDQPSRATAGGPGWARGQQSETRGGLSAGTNARPPLPAGGSAGEGWGCGHVRPARAGATPRHSRPRPLKAPGALSAAPDLQTSATGESPVPHPRVAALERGPSTSLPVLETLSSLLHQQQLFDYFSHQALETQANGQPLPCHQSMGACWLRVGHVYTQGYPLSSAFFPTPAASPPLEPLELVVAMNPRFLSKSLFSLQPLCAPAHSNI